MCRKKRRSLVLTQESAGHWFRRSLPPHVFAVTQDLLGEGTCAHDSAPHAPAGAVDADALAARDWRLSGRDWKGFAQMYCATFLVVSLFFA